MHTEPDDGARPDLRCYHHPEREATSQCDRCGDYLCAHCLQEYEGLHVCERCRTELMPNNTLSRVGRVACVLGLLAGLVWMVMLCLPEYDKEWDSVLPYALVSLVSGWAGLICAIAAFPKTGAPRRWLHRAVILWCACNAGFQTLAVMAIEFEFEQLDAIRFALPMRIGCVCLMLASLACWGVAMKKKVRPTWAAVLLPIPVLVFIVLVVIDLLQYR